MIHTGDCVTVMAGMPADSVDAIVTDPPYGLEFMGKAWDQFKTGRAAKYAEGGDFATAGKTSGRSQDKGDYSWFGSAAARPVYMKRPAKRCITCGKQAWSGSPCKCEKPEWREDNSPLHAFQAWCQSWATEALRVTKPGGYLLAFGGTRTHHRLVCGLEDAGWIIRDELDWIYASGFPKGRANLKPAHEPIVLARKPGPLRPLNIEETRIGYAGPGDEEAAKPASPGNPEGLYGFGGAWNGANPPGRWPSNLLLSDPELFDQVNPWVVGSGATSEGGAFPKGDIQIGWNVTRGSDLARRRDERVSLSDSGGYSRFFALSVRMDGRCQYCGVANAESSSSATTTPATPSDSTPESVKTNGSDETGSPAPSAASGSSDSITPTAPPRAPTSGGEGSGSRSGLPSTSASESESSKSSGASTGNTPRSKRRGTSPRSASPSDPATSAEVPETSSDTTTTTPSRWTCDACAVLVTRASTLDAMSTGAGDFPEVPASRPDSPRYLIIPKADRADREPVLRGQLPEEVRNITEGHGRGPINTSKGDGTGIRENRPRQNVHPTTKPTDLMRHLIRLVTPPGGTVLDPFLGSGSTAIAAELEGFPWLGIEREPEYVAIAEARLNGTQRGLGLDVAAPTRRQPKDDPRGAKRAKSFKRTGIYDGGWTPGFVSEHQPFPASADGSDELCECGLALGFDEESQRWYHEEPAA